MLAAPGTSIAVAGSATARCWAVLVGAGRSRVDERGVPYAEPDRPLTAPLGYVHAQDCLTQMEMLWRLARGELAGAQPKLVDTDRLFVRIRDHAAGVAARQDEVVAALKVEST